jgi:predicted nucleotidyltransferase
MNSYISFEEFEELKGATIYKDVVGSHLYNANNSSSDMDILNIYIKSKKQNYSFYWKHHQFQYKENNVDYIFVDLQLFIRNLLSGDSTINYELIHNMIDSEDFSFLYDLRLNFKTYNILKAYNGFAKRDLKDWVRNPNDKKLFHIVRGTIAFEKIMTDEYSNDARATPILLDIKNGKLSEKEKKEIHSEYENKNKEQRVALNALFESKGIGRFPDKKVLKQIDERIISLNEKYETLSNWNTFVYKEDVLELIGKEIDY